ncbi:tetratricopeptide repeat protein [Halobacteriovorax marinus]|uniref:tetratricopeptide repeat protein n=1 Tax=Halobacteriovorax marinus TaxID=97084 RepID=UPI003A93425C
MKENKGTLILMEENIRNLLTSELHCAWSYYERLIHAISDLSKIAQLPESKELTQKMNFDIVELLEVHVFSKDFINENVRNITLRELKYKCKDTTDLLERMIRLELNSDKTLDTTVNFINLLYEYAHEWHHLLSDFTDISIQLPRVNLIEAVVTSPKYLMDMEDEMNNTLKEESEELVDSTPRLHQSGFSIIDGGAQDDELSLEDDYDDIGEDSDHDDEGEEDKIIPLFKLDKENIIRFQGAGLGSIGSLEWQRDKKYDKLLHEGHEAVFEKNFAEALEKFTRALNYKETAEVLTLIGWVHSLDGRLDKAKTFCLKAIQTDADYGPPYNDLGTYLLSEGQVEESLKWFEMAKKSINYQNREYPYINAGRAYMTVKNLPKALEEFSKALTLAPYHEELHATVERLKKSIHTSSNKEEFKVNWDISEEVENSETDDSPIN